MQSTEKLFRFVSEMSALDWRRFLNKLSSRLGVPAGSMETKEDFFNALLHSVDQLGSQNKLLVAHMIKRKDSAQKS